MEWLFEFGRCVVHFAVDYYRTTLLAEETDPNKLNDLKRDLDNAQLYTPDQVQQVVSLFLGGADRDQLDPILDPCEARYTSTLDEDGQVKFKGNAKAFCRSAHTASSPQFCPTATPHGKSSRFS